MKHREAGCADAGEDFSETKTNIDSLIIRYKDNNDGNKTVINHRISHNQEVP
jgi:flagellar biosynthesis/type III secretory pathway chaperone